MSAAGAEPESRANSLLTAVVFVIIAVAGASDLLLDTAERRASPIHLVVEVAITALSLALAVRIWLHWRSTVRSLEQTRRSLTARQQERDEWKARAESALTGMRAAMEEQFSRWGLTPAEREVALLVLQGKGHKQIAVETHRSERTVRQHAVSVYDKSQLGGRAELAAFFLEGLFTPRE